MQIEGGRKPLITKVKIAREKIALHSCLGDAAHMLNFQSIPVCDYMTSPVHCVTPDEDLAMVYGILLKTSVSSLAVVESGKLIGVISRTDLLREGRKNVQGKDAEVSDLLEFDDKKIADVMTPDPVCVDKNVSVAQASQTMVKAGVHRVFVQSENELLGVFSTLDCMAVIRDSDASEEIKENMSDTVMVIDIEDTVAEAIDKLATSHVSGLVVVENEWPVGVFTQVEALGGKGMSEESTVEDVMDSGLICMPVTTSMRRAAQQGIRMRARRIVASESRHMRGVLSGMDFAKFVARER